MIKSALPVAGRAAPAGRRCILTICPTGKWAASPFRCTPKCRSMKNEQFMIKHIKLNERIIGGIDMSIDYKEWCKNNRNVTPLIRKMKSSLPEQYIGFYLSRIFGLKMEYQKQFDWLGRYSLDIYIPSLQLAIEYDGIYYHANKRKADLSKTSWCRSHGIFLIHIVEKSAEQIKSRKRNEVNYYFEKHYKNIDVAIYDLCLILNKRYNMSIQIDVDLNRDHEEIISYIQQKYHQKSIAYVWPESEDYWVDEENGLTRFDFLITDSRQLLFKCPHCGKIFRCNMSIHSDRKSLIPCDCEYSQIEQSFQEAIINYKEKGIVVTFDDSLQSRRLYDRMAMNATRIWRCQSKEEAELYKELGFDPQYIDVYLSLCEKQASNTEKDKG